ncbi:unnamed protein product [Acanthoscelides obtectus]|uniref:Uncharacterized protein n=1 Tax=Acanthoscelides obtectus TaxID=200917 RepID=A0A9P0K2J0_ACAOB|nr:unnamed protein product [Acanthoscelides obtectus]CAK1648067.1 hypothetical protein AOBTE_LOCUS15528 [Acanthoscelides obtectus]
MFHTNSVFFETGSSGGRSSRLFESRPRRNFFLGYGCCDCP